MVGIVAAVALAIGVVYFGSIFVSILLFCIGILSLACQILYATISAVFCLPLKSTAVQDVPKQKEGNSLRVVEWLLELLIFIPRITISMLWSPFHAVLNASEAPQPPAKTIECTTHLVKSPPGSPAQRLPKCMDCLRPTDPKNIIRCNQCNYGPCCECFRAHLAECINNGQVGLVCIRCYADIDADVFQTHLPPPLLAKMERFKQLDERTSCPACNGRLRLASAFSKRRATCVLCKNSWCFDCRKPFHPFKACKPTKQED